MSEIKNSELEKLYGEVKHLIETSRKEVYRVANLAMIQAYWNIGRLIVEEEQKGQERASYGSELVLSLSKSLTKDYGRGFTTTNLKYMRQFYQVFGKGHALRDQLTWTHYRLLLRVENEVARNYYLVSAEEQNWSTRTLERQIQTQYYERILASNPQETNLPSIPMEKGELEITQAKDWIKDPYVLEFLDIPMDKKIQESDLEEGLMNQLQSFLLELGKGFSFVGRQHRISAENSHFYVDLVFYNYILKCFVLIDLKTGKLSHEAIGQMDFYVRYFEDQVKLEGDNPTIGLILCAEKDNAIAKYSLLSDSKQIFASKYKTYLPTEEELQREIERGRHQIELENKLIN